MAVVAIETILQAHLGSRSGCGDRKVMSKFGHCRRRPVLPKARRNGWEIQGQLINLTHDSERTQRCMRGLALDMPLLSDLELPFDDLIAQTIQIANEAWAISALRPLDLLDLIFWDTA
eukprot:CAMPEP_0181169660 /NCGR_PEP_ID=MMETSP1096-20121128/936_1 /TAXON_ID=156174 ORGANISM="Chrysochromulina ericina, Strain CCMP281" /NCGR_SAMPLE_ID=MMETSP1096 /ASSEMBLY_ACC=CAM_ASM_000453 /LENGTH=117 /DNA_ID=CAMNT_0023257139 /DNA_START=186 /DNA_END=539 /DNA_ORIENTATION=-